jgi:hypothetical protein
MRCEDYPCCGHDDGACPVRIGGGRILVWRCVDCHDPVPPGFALCDACTSRAIAAASAGEDV